MNLYDKYVLPRITNLLCAANPVMRQREKIIPLAEGTVLEIGVGSGLNFKYYNPIKVDHLFALDPSEEMWNLAQRQLKTSSLKVDYVKGVADSIPLDSNSIDSITITYTLCSIDEVQTSLAEMKRVLKPGGHLLFCEHGRSPDPGVLKWQNRLNPVWKRLGGGCNLNRYIPGLLEEESFTIQDLNTMYIPGFKPACYNFWGFARPKS